MAFAHSGLVSAAGVASASSPAEHTLVADVRSAAVERIKRGTVPGLVIAIVENGAVPPPPLF